MKRAVCRTANKFTKLPMFEPLLGLDKFSNVTDADYARYFGPYLIELYGTEMYEHLVFETTIIGDKEFMPIFAKPQSQRTYFIVSEKHKLELLSGMKDSCRVREMQVVAMSNPLASQVGITARVRDCIGKANVTLICVYPKMLLEEFAAA